MSHVPSREGRDVEESSALLLLPARVEGHAALVEAPEVHLAEQREAGERVVGGRSSAGSGLQDPQPVYRIPISSTGHGAAKRAEFRVDRLETNSSPQLLIAADNVEGPFLKTKGFIQSDNSWANFDLSFPTTFP